MVGLGWRAGSLFFCGAMDKRCFFLVSLRGSVCMLFHEWFVYLIVCFYFPPSFPSFSIDHICTFLFSILSCRIRGRLYVQLRNNRV